MTKSASPAATLLDLLTKQPETTGVGRQVAICFGKRRALDNDSYWVEQSCGKTEQLKSIVWVKVEHLFKLIKCQYTFMKVSGKAHAQKHGATGPTFCVVQSLVGTGNVVVRR